MSTETWTLFWWMLYSCVAVSGFCFLGGWIFGRKAKLKGGYQPTHGNLDSSNPPRGGSGILSKGLRKGGYKPRPEGKCKPAIPTPPPPRRLPI